MRKWDALVRDENLLKYIFGSAHEAPWRQWPPYPVGRGRRLGNSVPSGGEPPLILRLLVLHVRLGQRAGTTGILIDENAGYRRDFVVASVASASP
jgi:hypothetical protein